MWGLQAVLLVPAAVVVMVLGPEAIFCLFVCWICDVLLCVLVCSVGWS